MKNKRKNSKEYMKWRARTTAKILLTRKAVYQEIWGLLRERASAEVDAQLLSAQDVQALFKIGHSTYYRWIASGWLNPTRIHGRHYFQKQEITALLEKRRYRSRGGLG